MRVFVCARVSPCVCAFVFVRARGRRHRRLCVCVCAVLETLTVRQHLRFERLRCSLPHPSIAPSLLTYSHSHNLLSLPPSSPSGSHRTRPGPTPPHPAIRAQQQDSCEYVGRRQWWRQAEGEREVVASGEQRVAGERAVGEGGREGGRDRWMDGGMERREKFTLLTQSPPSAPSRTRPALQAICATHIYENTHTHRHTQSNGKNTETSIRRTLQPLEQAHDTHTHTHTHTATEMKHWSRRHGRTSIPAKG